MPPRKRTSVPYSKKLPAEKLRQLEEELRAMLDEEGIAPAVRLQVRQTLAKIVLDLDRLESDKGKGAEDADPIEAIKLRAIK